MRIHSLQHSREERNEQLVGEQENEALVFSQNWMMVVSLIFSCETARLVAYEGCYFGRRRLTVIVRCEALPAATAPRRIRMPSPADFTQ